METTVLVCVKFRFGNQASCNQGGAAESLAAALERELAAREIAVPVKRLLCFGRCEEGPNVRIAPGGTFFTRMNPERIGEVVEAVRVVLAAPRPTP